MNPSSLIVSLGGQEVGSIWRSSSDFYFMLLESYLNAPDRPVLGQWFEDRLTTRRYKRGSLSPWFANALPERGGALRRKLCRTFGIGEDDDFALLWKLGHNLPGATMISPSDEHYADDSVEEPYGDASESNGLRMSLGGIQLKFTLSGPLERLTLNLNHNDTQWLVKIPSEGYRDLPEVEDSIMKWCKASGFDVPQCHVIAKEALPDLGPLPQVDRVFIIERFDRPKGKRVHQEDFAQVLNVHPSRKYNRVDTLGLAKLAQAILDEGGLKEFFRRLVAVIATGNGDAHLKNWSLLYRHPQVASWSPLYDQVATIAWPDLDQCLALKIGHASYWRDVKLTNLTWMGAQLGIPERMVQEWVESTLEQMAKAFEPESFGMPKDLISKLREHWSSVPLLKAHGPV